MENKTERENAVWGGLGFFFVLLVCFVLGVFWVWFFGGGGGLFLLLVVGFGLFVCVWFLFVFLFSGGFSVKSFTFFGEEQRVARWFFPVVKSFQVSLEKGRNCQIPVTKVRNTSVQGGILPESGTGWRGEQEVCVTVWLL